METESRTTTAGESADGGADLSQAAESFDMGTSGLPGRNVLDMAVVKALSLRSDLHGFLRFGAHLGVMAATGSLVWFSRSTWWLMVPAMLLHGFTIVTMFAPMHECVHKTAFRSHRLNDFFGWIAGAICFYNFTYYRRYHTWHHRYTQDHERDPELSTPKPRRLFDYLLHVSGIPFWIQKPRELLMLASGRLSHLPYLTAESGRVVAISAAAQLSVYLLLLGVSFVTGNPAVLFYWLLPALLAQPLLRAILIAEHTGCSEDANGLTNTRTTLTTWPVRLLMWNMPFHAEHHLYPSIPFHKLAQAHEELRKALKHIAPGYVAANRTIIRTLETASHSQPD